MKSITSLFNRNATDDLDDLESVNLIVPENNKCYEYLQMSLMIVLILALFSFILCVVFFISVSLKLTHVIHQVLPMLYNATKDFDDINYYIQELSEDGSKIGNILGPLLTAIKQIAKDIHKII